MASKEAASERWRHVKTKFQLFRNVAFLAGMSFLDFRDLWYKLTWIGAYDTFAFTAGSRGTLLPTPLPYVGVLPSAFSDYATEQFSGWPSYLSRCDSLTPFCSPGSTFFLNAMGSNCQVGVKGENKTIERLVMTSNVRADSMAWAACQLLYGSRRPAICHENIVTNFEHRYHFQAMEVLSEWMAPIDSPAEEELIRFLGVIASSHPRHKVVCTGGLAYTTPGEYKPKIFGCASANVFRAEYVGVYATHFHELAFDKAWLTDIDIITLADVSYKIRQNTINRFIMEEETIDGQVALSITEDTKNNFVSTGLLYVLMIIIDIILLLSQMYTGVELVTQWILPVMRKRDPNAFDHEDDASLQPVVATDTEEELFSKEEYTSFLTSSLYRHRAVVFLTVISQIISWGIIIPNSVVWTWSLSNYSKAMAFASSLRLWTLILIGLNTAWDTVVFFFEKHAYLFARATYVSTFEVIAVGVIVAFSFKDAVMAISEAKFGVERQRINDFMSFPAYVAHGNTFNEALDYSPNSQGELLSIMYLPLVKIVFYSVLGLFGWLVAKLVVTQVLEMPPFSRWLYAVKAKLHLNEGESPYHVGKPGQAAADRKKMTNSAHFRDPRDQKYRRVPLEKLLDIPMRARSLVRPTLSMQKTLSGEALLRPAIHLDFGVYVHGRKVTARTGFWTTIRPACTLPLPPGASRSATRAGTMASATSFKGVLMEDQLPPLTEISPTIQQKEERHQSPATTKTGGAIVHAVSEDQE